MSTRRRDCAWKVSADQSTEIRATTWNTDSQTGRITSSYRSGSLTITLPTAGGEACRFQRIGSLEYGRRPLRSSTDRTLTVPRTHNRFGDRSFAVAGPRLWNSLPISLRKISSYRQFRRYLKNHLFGIWEITAQCDAWFSALYKYSYLLTYLLIRSRSRPLEQEKLQMPVHVLINFCRQFSSVLVVATQTMHHGWPCLD